MVIAWSCFHKTFCRWRTLGIDQLSTGTQDLSKTVQISCFHNSLIAKNVMLYSFLTYMHILVENIVKSNSATVIKQQVRSKSRHFLNFHSSKWGCLLKKVSQGCDTFLLGWDTLVRSYISKVSQGCDTFWKCHILWHFFLVRGTHYQFYYNYQGPYRIWCFCEVYLNILKNMIKPAVAGPWVPHSDSVFL